MIEISNMSQSFHKKHLILLVDDEEINRILLTSIIDDRGDCEILCAKNGAEAIDLSKRFQPDLIILDILMPVMTGFEVMEILKQNPCTNEIPVIFISALSETNHEAHAFQLGACDYIHKPFHSDIVQARIGLQLKLIEQRLLLDELVHIDPLTAIANRRKFTQDFKIQWLKCLDEEQPLTVAMIDIDCFKLHNDSFGHTSGDKVLKQVASTLANTINSISSNKDHLVARYGGEEFILLMPGTKASDVETIIESCRLEIEKLDVRIQATQEQAQYINNNTLTISLGGVTCKPSKKLSPNWLLNAADALLYDAKKSGKNQVHYRNELLEEVSYLDA